MPRSSASTITVSCRSVGRDRGGVAGHGGRIFKPQRKRRAVRIGHVISMINHFFRGFIKDDDGGKEREISTHVKRGRGRGFQRLLLSLLRVLLHGFMRFFFFFFFFWFFFLFLSMLAFLGCWDALRRVEGHRCRRRTTARAGFSLKSGFWYEGGLSFWFIATTGGRVKGGIPPARRLERKRRRRGCQKGGCERGERGERGGGEERMLPLTSP